MGGNTGSGNGGKRPILSVKKGISVYKMKKLIATAVLVMTLYHSGCKLAGLIGTESQYEKKIPAEYNLYKVKDKKILVLVEQPGWLDVQANLRYYLTKAINKSLEVKVKIKPESIISYDELSEFRSQRGDISLLSPTETGKGLGADLVLMVMIEDCKLSDLAATDYYDGAISIKSALFDTATGLKVWPSEERGKSVKVGFETGEKGLEGAVDRLANGCAYCTTRYFYDCPRYKFKIFDERSGSGWSDWE